MRSDRTAPRRLARATLLIRAGAGLAVLWLGVNYGLSHVRPSRPEVLLPVSLHLPELNCAFWCPIQIDDALGDVPGLFDLEVSVEEGRVSAFIDPDRITREQLAERLLQRGWKVEGFAK